MSQQDKPPGNTLESLVEELNKLSRRVSESTARLRTDLRQAREHLNDTTRLQLASRQKKEAHRRGKN